MFFLHTKRIGLQSRSKSDSLGPDDTNYYQDDKAGQWHSSDSADVDSFFIRNLSPQTDFFGYQKRPIPLSTPMTDPYVIGVDGSGYVNFTNPDYSSLFRTTVIASPLFSKNDIDKKFREIGTFYDALNGHESDIHSDAQITEAMALWADQRFPQKEEKGIAVKAYQVTFTKLYAYIERIQSPQVAAMVLRAVDALAETLAVHVKETIPNSEKLVLPPALGMALGEALFTTDAAAFSWRNLVAALHKPAASAVRLFSNAVAFLGNNEKAINALCLARVQSNPTLGLQLFIQLLQKNIPSEAVGPVFSKLNTAYFLNTGDKRLAAFDAVFSNISDVNLKNNLETALLVLAKIYQSKEASVSEIQAKFAGSFLQGCIVDTLTVLFDRGLPRDVPEEDHHYEDVFEIPQVSERNLYSFRPSELVPLSESREFVSDLVDEGFLEKCEFLKLPYVPVDEAHLQRAYEAVLDVLRGKIDEDDLAHRLGISVSNLESRCDAIRHAYAKHTIYTAALQPEPSLKEKLALYKENGVFRTTRDIAASKYTDAEKGAAIKLFDFYFNNLGFVVSKGGKIKDLLGLDRRETQALYGIAAVNKPAFEVLEMAAEQMGVYARFLLDMQSLQDNPAVQKLIANQLRVDGAMHPLDRDSYHEWTRFFSATLPRDLNLSPVTINYFKLRKDSLPSPVLHRIERGLLMSAIVGEGTALNLRDTGEIQTEKNTKRALIFEFSRKGASVFEDKDPGKDKRAEFRTLVVSAFSKTKSKEVRNEFREYVKGNHAAVEALNKSYTTFSDTLNDFVDRDAAMKTALKTVFPLPKESMSLNIGNSSAHQVFVQQRTNEDAPKNLSTFSGQKLPEEKVEGTHGVPREILRRQIRIANVRSNHMHVEPVEYMVDCSPPMTEVYVDDSVSDQVVYYEKQVELRSVSNVAAGSARQGHAPLDTGTLSPNNHLGRRHSVVVDGLLKTGSRRTLGMAAMRHPRASVDIDEQNSV